MLHTTTLLPDLHTAEEITRAAADLVVSLIGADDLLFTELDLRSTNTFVRRGPDFRLQENLSESSSKIGHLLPAVVSYLEPGDDRRPRQVSDVVPTRLWRSSVKFDEAFHSRGALYQLSLVTRLERDVGKGWVLTRSDPDFSESDVETAHLILPLLTALTELAEAKKELDGPGCESLTPREHAVLELLATGSSARTIARDLGMTEATVRKHLSHIYVKLGVHDRLSAVLCLNRTAH